MFFESDQELSQGESSIHVSPIKLDHNAHFLTSLSYHQRESVFLSSEKDKSQDCWSTSGKDMLERQIMQTNADMLKRALEEFLGHCSSEPIEKGAIISNGNSFYFQKSSDSGEQDKNYQALISKNELLSKQKKLHLQKFYRQRQQLRDFFAEVNQLFKPQIAQELAFIIAVILEHKMQAFEECLAQNSLEYLPKIDRIWGEEDHEQVLHGGWRVFEDIDQHTIKQFATRKTQRIVNELYGSPQLSFLTFKENRQQLSLQTFESLISFICQNIFLSISGISQSEEALYQYTEELYFENGGPQQRTKKKAKLL